MSICVEEIHARNFRSFANVVWQLGGPGLVAVTGKTKRKGFSDNGAAKTTLINIAAYALWGETLEGSRDADSLVKIGSTGGLLASATLKVDGEAYRVERYRADPRHANQVHLRRWKADGDEDGGGSWVSHTAGRNDATQAAIDALVGPFAHFALCVSHSATRPLSAFAEMPSSKVKAVLSDLLHLRRFEVAEARAKREVLDVDRGIAERQQALTAAKDFLSIEVDFGKPPKRPNGDGIDDAKERIAELEEKLMRLPVVGTPRSDLKAAVVESEADLRAADAAYARAKSKHASLRSGTCDSCGQPIPIDKAARKRAKAAMYAAGHAVDAIKMELDQRRRALEDAKPDERRLLLRLEMSELSAKVAVHRTARKAYAEAKARYERQRANHDAKRAECSRIVMSETEALDRLTKKRARIAFWAEHFGPRGVRSHLLDGYLAELSQVATEHARRRFFGGDAEIVISPLTTLKDGRERDEIDTKVRIPGFGANYEDLSRAQKRRVDLCITFALATLGSRSKFAWKQLFLDELLDGIDEAGRRIAIDAVRELAKDRQVVVVTRDPKVLDAADRVVTVEHDGKLPYGTSEVK